MAVAVDNAARAEYDTWIRSDWTFGADSTKFNNFFRSRITLHQVLSCIDVSVSMYRQLGEEEEDDDEDDDDASMALIKKSAATRMLRLQLFNGRDHQVAYEYEPIACLDVFHANRLTGNPVRCCGKIALINSPVERRGVLWLTRHNVKLVFEGFECRKHCEVGSSSPVNRAVDRAPTQALPATSVNVPQSATNEQQQDRSSNAHRACISYCADDFDEVSQKRAAAGILDFELPVKRFNAHTVDERILSPVEQYFPSGSSYVEFAYTSYLVRSNAVAGDASYEQFTHKFLRTYGFMGCFSIAQALSSINRSPGLQEPSDEWLSDNAHFGFLDHAVPLDVIERSDISDVANNELREVGFNHTSGLWLVNLNDCSACFFCLVSVETLGITSSTPLAVSRLINAVNGFFEIKRFRSGACHLHWISQYRRNLDDAEFARRTRAIQAEFERMEALMDF
ncbi:recQ-mediated genome instability 1 [Babesia ovata]|uniref:RecQ-mediated genome instability 1 n=1 Tax=Babesia ovata TaxID=189622 RepID=A0A2H6KH16_9APIC|nr:recQ-mediated genome instability 1 [Babesia ovata]GBE62277.1 recQ-mediated genome instability 1 [Babesia ovata]